MRALDIVPKVIAYQSLQGKEVTPLKLQKLLYYIQAYHLAIAGETLFSDKIEAWQYGPVIPAVYHKYKDLGNQPIPQMIIDEDTPSELNSASEGIISAVLAAYGDYSAVDLVSMTHSEPPWIEAYTNGSNSIISDERMKEYYKQFVTE